MHVVSVCPLRVASQLWQPAQGGWVLTVVCKATYQLAPTESALAESQEYCQEEENHWNDEATHSLYAPSDLVPFKPSPEVMLVGHAFAPRGQAVARLLVHVAVGEVDKSIEIRGDQSFQRDGSLRDGPRFVRMPLRYERAAGGPDTQNPVGIQLDAPNSLGIVQLPNLRPPGRADLQPGEFVEPIGLGPLAASWPTRRRRLGALAGVWSEAALAREPLPEGIDPQYFMSAPPDQALEVLRPDERIVLVNLHPKHPRLVTSLPGVEPRAFVNLPQQAPSELRLVCDTLWIDTDRSICTLTWRGLLPLQRPEQKGRVVVAMEQSGRPLSWVEVEPLAREHAQRVSWGERDGDETDVSLPAVAPAPALPFGGPTPKAAPAIVLDPRTSRQTDKIPIPGDVTAPFGNRGSVGPAWLHGGRVDTAPSAIAKPPPVPSRVLGTPSPPSPPPLPSPPAPVLIAAPIHPAPRPPQAPLSAVMPAPVALVAPVAFGASGASGAPSRDASPWGAGARQSSPSLEPLHAGPSALSITPSAPLFPLVAAAAPALASTPAAAPALASAASPSESSWLQSQARATASAVFEAPEKTGRGAPRLASSADLRDPAAPASSPSLQAATGQPSAREHIDLIGFDLAALPKIRASAAPGPGSAPQAGSVSWLTTETSARAEPPEVIDRRDVLRVLTRAPATEEALSRAVSSAFRDDGSFEPPVIVVAGDIAFAFDEMEALKATITVTTPFIGIDKKLREAVTAATEVLKAEWKPPADVAEGFTHRLEEAFAQGPRAVAPGYLQTSVKRMLLESRSYQKKTLFGERRIRALLNLPGRAAVPAYLPEALGPKLPLFVRFRASAIVELRPQEDEHETHPEAILVLALGRLLRERG